MRCRRSLLFFALFALATAATASSARAADDPYSSKQWNMALVGAEQAWAVGSGAGAVIAVVDTGVHLGHEDLAVGDKLLPGRNYVTPDTPPQDDNGHGTHVAGIAAAAANNGKGVVGLAPSARIMPIKVLNANGGGSYGNVASAVRWAADNGANVVNLSLGSTVGNLIGNPDVFIEAIRYAWSTGALCVVAAGNDLVLSSSFADEPAIVVSATTRHDKAATYSNGVGETQWGLAAPGGSGGVSPLQDDVYSTYWPHAGPGFSFGSYEYLAGTSMAAPHVAGAAALLRSLGLTPQQTVDRLLTTAKDLGAPGKDTQYGHGRLDVAKAVAGLGASGGGGNGGAGTGGGATATTGSPNGGGSRGGTSGNTSGGVDRGTGSGAGSSSPRGPGDGARTTDSGREAGSTATGDSGEGGPSGDEERGVGMDEVGLGERTGPGDGSGTGGNGSGDGVPWPLAVLGVGALVALAATVARSARRLGRPTPPG